MPGIKLNEMKPAVIILIASIFILILLPSCNLVEDTDNKFNESLMVSKYCEKNDDCVVTSRKFKDCCGPCHYEAINKQADLEREKWENINCGVLDYKKCLWAECTYGESDAACLFNQCELIPKNSILNKT